MTAAGHLTGYRILDLSDERGLLAGWMLARLGADVIQVEPPAGSHARTIRPLDHDAPSGQQSLFWSAYAAGKRGVSCNLELPAGRALLFELARDADFVIESAGPGAMQERGLGYAEFKAINPGLIYVSISAFGCDGPKKRYAATDLVIWASAGTIWLCRDRSGAPLRISVPQAYLHAAADAACGALTALFARHRSGHGQHVDVSAQQSTALAALSTTLAAAVGHSNYQFPADATAKKRQVDMSGSGARTRRSKWPMKDGLLEMHLGVGPAAGRSANSLFGWMREENALPPEFDGWDWISLPRKLMSGEVTEEQMERAREAVARFVSRLSKNDIMDIAMQRGILMAPAMTIEDLAESPQLKVRRFFENVREQGRERTLPSRFTTGTSDSFVPLRPAPSIGEHNTEVYGGLLGKSADELQRLQEGGVI